MNTESHKELDRKLDDILDDTIAKVFCKGQDRKKGDGSASSLDKDSEQLKSELKALMLNLVGEDEVSITKEWDCACGVHHTLTTGSSRDRDELRAELRSKIQEL